MIKLKQASLALHSCDVPGYKYQMHTTWTMPKGATAENVVYWINYARQRAPEMYLHNVVINCHGSPGGLHIGGDAGKPGGFLMTKAHTGSFQKVRQHGDVGRLIPVTCEVASGNKTDDKLGKDFCQKLAIDSGCFVGRRIRFKRWISGSNISGIPMVRSTISRVRFTNLARLVVTPTGRTTKFIIRASPSNKKSAPVKEALLFFVMSG